MKTFYYWIRSVFRQLTGSGIEIYELIPGLFQASAFDETDWAKIQSLSIQVIIDLNGNADDIPGVKVIRWPILDEAKLPDLDRLNEVALEGAKWVSQDAHVMTHCSLGKNRSGLVNGVILTKIGMTGKQAVALIQSKVPGALFNSVFREYLETL